MKFNETTFTKLQYIQTLRNFESMCSVQHIVYINIELVTIKEYLAQAFCTYDMEVVEPTLVCTGKYTRRSLILKLFENLIPIGHKVPTSNEG